MPTTYHVSKKGSDKNTGGEDSPLRTINAAATIAKAGDSVVVHEGEYREWVNPSEGGHSDTRRISYRAADGEEVVIKGSERVECWECEEGDVWKAVLSNTMFGDYNPYKEILSGDWLIYRSGILHTGDVYLNGKSFYEAENREELNNPQIRTELLDHWTEEIVPVNEPEQTKYLWYSEVDDENTTIWANFHGADPNIELVEINVRKCCFYPESTGVNYITVRGFEMAHAACPWAPPTGDQPGLLGTHWSLGWIIENNIIHDAKCSAISIGKEASTGDNWCTTRMDKPGYQHQLESVFAAAKIGWSREKIGSHIIRNNTVYDCGQNGIVGHLGCIFSEIYGNHIFNIALKREFYGHEIAGIKLHAPLDVYIHNNYIHDCSLGVWMDWQAQGTRISRNLFCRNNRDLFIEVSHGPYVVDHNILGSKYSLDNHSQGGAYVNNLFAGKIILKKILDRATPFHAPHTTDVAGYAMIYGGDDRLYGNLFIGKSAGSAVYNGHTASLEEYKEKVQAKQPGDHDIYNSVEQPVYAAGNMYLGGAAAFDQEEENAVLSDFDAKLSLEEKNGSVYLACTLPENFAMQAMATPNTQTLGHVRIVGADFEDMDGKFLCFDSDWFGAKCGEKAVPGPIATFKAGENKYCIWQADN